MVEYDKWRSDLINLSGLDEHYYLSQAQEYQIKCCWKDKWTIQETIAEVFGEPNERL